MALMQLLLSTGSLEAARAALSDPGLEELRTLLNRNEQGAARALALLAGIDHRHEVANAREGVAYFRRAFDEAVRLDPVASVALYSLGNEEILAAATAELGGLLRAWSLLGPDRRLLDLGCGIGRIEVAVAGEVGAITGIDVSPGMLAEAGRRCAGLANVRLFEASAADLGVFEDGTFDVVLAVDSFPYLVQAGAALPAGCFREAARVLAPGGTLVIFNYSYRNDLAADRGDVQLLAAQAGFHVERNGTRDLRLWDGVSFRLRRV